MIKHLLTAFFLLNVLVIFAQTTVIDSIEHDGIQRDFRLYIPAAYDGSTAVPLVLNIHGRGSNAGQQELYGNLKPQADADNFLIVHPNSTEIMGTTLWNSSFFSASDSNYVDDVGFLGALLDTLMANYSIDTSKVYSTGMSNGGFMSYSLACELGSRIKKIASVTGSMSPSLYNSCSPNRSVPVLQIHGTADPTVPYDATGVSPGIEAVVDFWVQNNNCDTTPEVFNFPDINITDNSTVERYVYSNATDSNSVVFYKVINGGHTWPNALIDIPSGNTNKDFDASTAVWEFFKDEAFVPTSIKPLAERDAIQLSVSKNELVATARDVEIKRLKIITTLGQIINTSKNTNKIDISALSPAYYFVIIETDKGAFAKPFMK